MKVKIGIEGKAFDAAHYTLSSPSDDQIHGHTYLVSVEVEGEVDEKTGFVLDFNTLQTVVCEELRGWDHKLLIPEKDLDKITLHGPFRTDIRVVKDSFATAEFIAMEMAKSLHNKLGQKFRISVKVYEGQGKYALVEYP
ncbi:6-pyruvoyl tetrahydrobiopterin synthase [Sulfolobales archaeon HS-7]|nr:6-pyruvoyl tetrahydrobiopterin synthase [Sulfolobales archaeon HS-7]